MLDSDTDPDPSAQTCFLTLRTFLIFCEKRNWTRLTARIQVQTRRSHYSPLPGWTFMFKSLCFLLWGGDLLSDCGHNDSVDSSRCKSRSWSLSLTGVWLEPGPTLSLFQQVNYTWTWSPAPHWQSVWKMRSAAGKESEHSPPSGPGPPCCTSVFLCLTGLRGDC